VAIQATRAGFVLGDRLVYADVENLIHVRQPSGDFDIELPGAFIYRVSDRADAPDKLLISGQWQSETDVFAIEYDLVAGEQNMLEFMAQLVEQVNTGTQGFSRQNVPVTPTISATAFIMHLSGTGTITNITPAKDFSGLIALIGDSAFTLNPGGNIATATPIAVEANQLALLLYSPVTQLWYPIAGGGSSAIIQQLNTSAVNAFKP